MHIIYKNKNIFCGNLKAKCAFGKKGVGLKRREGDLITPIGIYKINQLFYRKDRVKNLYSKIKKKIIRKNMGWCNDPKSPKYNRLIKYPYNFNSEKLYREDNIYDIILILNYNMRPTKKNKGSAIFIHVAKKKFQKTEGCLAIQKDKLKKLVKLINKNTKVIIT